MSLFSELADLLPSDEELLSNLSQVISGDQIILQISRQLTRLKDAEAAGAKTHQNVSNSLEMLNVLIDFLHENLHMGEWHAVDVKLRKSYSVACFFKVLLSLYDCCDSETLDEAAYILDMAIMLGDRLVKNIDDEELEVLQLAASYVSKHMSDLTAEQGRGVDMDLAMPQKQLKLDNESYESCKCDIDKRSCPSIEYFLQHHFNPQKPLLITNSIEHWPAMERWRDGAYLVSKAGSRTVPVEMGSKYTSDNWSQNLVRFSEFFEQCVLRSAPQKKPPQDEEGEVDDDIAYLAQHDLFDQISELKDDICVPEYVCVSEKEPRIKAWLGPKGTVSPLHTDPTHNLLCQVFGKKKVILAAPDETEKLYPHEHFILNNTSQVDAENIDYEKFPLTKSVKFYELTLQRGDVLYLPPKWWHFVKSLAPSFSVSFWFE